MLSKYEGIYHKALSLWSIKKKTSCRKTDCFRKLSLCISSQLQNISLFTNQYDFCSHTDTVLPYIHNMCDLISLMFHFANHIDNVLPHSHMTLQSSVQCSLCKSHRQCPTTQSYDFAKYCAIFTLQITQTMSYHTQQDDFAKSCVMFTLHNHTDNVLSHTERWLCKVLCDVHFAITQRPTTQWYDVVQSCVMFTFQSHRQCPITHSNMTV